MLHRGGATHGEVFADCGLVGLPNAGKSTFINAVSNAKAKVGDYPFTTVRPQLGVASHKGREFVVADIPGLIEGAAEGAGIGDRFLGHIERCRVLLHLIDASGDDPIDAYEIVCGELESYGAGLADKLAKKLAKKSGVEVMRLSGATGEGLEPVLDRIIEVLGPAPETAANENEEGAEPWSPI